MKKIFLNLIWNFNLKGSWTYDGFQVDITNRTEDIDLNNYVQNGEWDLIKTSVVRNVVYYPCCPGNFYSLHSISNRLILIIEYNCDINFI